jgi:hypothetical protein
MDGPLPFQSAQRVQANTLEQLPLVLAPLWLCATIWATPGRRRRLLWCVGRILYALGYYRDPASAKPASSSAWWPAAPWLRAACGRWHIVAVEQNICIQSSTKFPIRQ